MLSGLVVSEVVVLLQGLDGSAVSAHSPGALGPHLIPVGGDPRQHPPAWGRGSTGVEERRLRPGVPTCLPELFAAQAGLCRASGS